MVFLTWSIQIFVDWSVKVIISSFLTIPECIKLGFFVDIVNINTKTFYLKSINRMNIDNCKTEFAIIQNSLRQ